MTVRCVPASPLVLSLVSPAALPSPRLASWGRPPLSTPPPASLPVRPGPSPDRRPFFWRDLPAAFPAPPRRFESAGPETARDQAA